jgi:hypothetical protein
LDFLENVGGGYKIRQGMLFASLGLRTLHGQFLGEWQSFASAIFHTHFGVVRFDQNSAEQVKVIRVSTRGVKELLLCLRLGKYV